MDTNKVEFLPSINQFIPTEMLKKILENLDYKSLHFAKQTCKLWKDIIEGFELVKKTSGKFLENMVWNDDCNCE